MFISQSLNLSFKKTPLTLFWPTLLQLQILTLSTLPSFRFLQQIRAIDKLMLRRRDMLKMVMKPIVDVDGNSLRDSDDNDDDEAITE